MPRPTVIYLHGFASGFNGDSPKTGMIEQLGYPLRWALTDGDYTPAGYQRAVAALNLDLARPLVFMGTSLGGFWARELGNRWGQPWIALNPALRPERTLAPHTGTLPRYDNGALFTWTAADNAAYEHWPREVIRPEVPGLIIVAEDDDTIPFQDTLPEVGTAELLVLPQGGHPLHNTEDFEPLVARFLEQQSHYSRITGST